MTTYNEIMEEFKQEIEQGIELDDIRDRSYEYVDNYVPVYNNRVIEEWQNMDSEYDNRGAAELGYDVEHLDIIKLMQADLYLYYQDLVSLVLNDLAEEIEEASSDES
jgi:hypothetical protein